MNKIKGTKDYFGAEAQKMIHIKDVFFDCCYRNNYSYVESPIIEYVDLFKRSSGEMSDIVSKEMYTFLSKSNKQLALRPEGTAPFIRLFLENKLMNERFKTYFYFGPMFRYEQPQKGRYRQFNQLGIENISQVNYINDFQVLMLAFEILNKLNIKDFKLIINNIGTIEERAIYKNVLKEYLSHYKEQLEQESLARLDANVLRILDDKKEQGKDFIKNCPKIIDFLSEESKLYFENIKNLLTKFNFDFEVDFNLVRGLDYYNNLVFEFVSTSKALGSQAAIIAGGRYQIKLENECIDAIGFAGGIERILEILNYNNFEVQNELTNLIVILNEEERIEALKLFKQLSENARTYLYPDVIKLNKAFKLTASTKAHNLVFKNRANNSSNWIIKNQITKEIKNID
ncbi:histidine--tRNA ligase [Mycoplasma phocimorsus]|uniref:histidine--tRNA ligase n=1 Tax=Mycoplasma phocimorsus TaxID=3045839 RepID=UPI0024C00D05|nr:histidine--tRNA ligase [Mycoplasma phocimorsus]MDJ1648418.1 histidine--tRNA ligase [Mycoplasma phocimorsus]